jgi:hypothetical protein
MMDVSTVALNMTFLVTLGIGFLIFLAYILLFVTILMLAGAAYLAALTFTAIWNCLPRAEATASNPDVLVIGKRVRPGPFRTSVTKPSD